jgi:Spy/CpxP family protein refolding chaperone
MKHTHLISIATASFLLAVSAGAWDFAGKGKDKRGDSGFQEDTEGLGPQGKHLRRGQSGRGHRNGAMRGVERLELTAEQKTRIESFRADHKKATESLMDKEQALREKTRAAWQAAQPNEAAIMSLHREAHKVRGELAEYRIQLRLDIISVLTPEQRAEMQSFRSERRERRSGRGRF